MGKSLADAMNAQPGPDSLAYWLAPLKGYLDRQGRMAQQGLQMADEGAQAVRGGDFSGLGGALLGPVAYLSSPINALFPERSEVDAATDVPSWSKPLIAGGLETMAIMAPGPKGKGLGRGMAQLADDATDAERAALATRLETEARQQIPPFTAYHGSTLEGLTTLKPGQRGPFGPANYLSPVEGVARRYGDKLYEVTVNPNEIFNGLGSRYLEGDVNGYALWRDQVARVAQASGDKADQVAAALGRLDPQDGYRAYHDLMRIVGGDAEAQAILQRAGFKGVSGHVDGPEIAMFGDLNLAAPASRDQALRNLTEAPEGKTKKNFATQSYQETLPDGTVKWLPGTLRVNPPKKVFEPEMSPAYMRLLGLDPNKKYTPPKGMNSTAYKETYEDGTVEWVPGLMRVKRPPKQ